MSLIPNRPPATPLMQFHGVGKYEKKINGMAKGLRHPAEPGVSALLLERNLSQDDLNVKPQLHDLINSKFYIPQKYLNPYQSQLSTFPIKTKVESGPHNSSTDISLNNTKRAKIN